MRFRATFSEHGVRTLEKGCLPTLEKFGKTCQVLLGPQEVHFIQTSLNTDGPHVFARFAVGVLFDETRYSIQSKHCNLIAFSVDLALLVRVLKGADTNDAESLDVKLAQKTIDNGVGGSGADGDAATGVTKPFLSFVSRGQSLSLQHDLPISKPFSASEIDRLIQAKDGTALCPFYLDLAAVCGHLQSVADKMRGVGSVLRFATCKNGDVHLQIAATNVLVGNQVQKLPVYPSTVQANEAVINRDATAEEQLQVAEDHGEALSVHLQLKHLSKILHVSTLTSPAQILCGIAESRGHVHVMYVYRDVLQEAAFDESKELMFKLPVREDD